MGCSKGFARIAFILWYVGEIMKKNKVMSSNIDSIGYDRNNNILEVKFNNGAVYQYNGVTAAIHRSLMMAKSVGEFFAKHVKNVYPTKKL